MKIETEVDTPESGLKNIPLVIIEEPVLTRYAFKVAWWMNADGFTAEQENYIKTAYGRGYHPRRTAKELQETL